MKSIIGIIFLSLLSSATFASTYSCTLISTVNQRVADASATKVELNDGMNIMAEIVKTPVFASAAIKQVGDSLYLEVHTELNDKSSPLVVNVIHGKADGEIGFFYSNGKNKSVKVDCSPL
jgi:hypothetical protein